MIRRASQLFAGLCLVAVAEAADVWLTDVVAARAQAVKERKEVLVEFTGSDWSPACIALRKQVIDTEDFARLERRFVLVRIDFPRKKKLPEETAERNAATAAALAITSYPTVMLLDAKTGEEFGRITGYGGKSAAVYVAELIAFQNTPDARAALRERELVAAAERDQVRYNEKLIDAAIQAKDYAAAAGIIDEIYKGIKGPRRAVGTLNKAILSHRIEPAALERTWKLLQQALLEAEDDADLAKAINEMARRISPTRKLEKAKAEPKKKADTGA